MLLVFWVDQNPTDTPVSLIPMTWVWIPVGKFSFVNAEGRPRLSAYPWFGGPAAPEPKYPAIWPRLLMPSSWLNVGSLLLFSLLNDQPRARRISRGWCSRCELAERLTLECVLASPVTAKTPPTAPPTATAATPIAATTVRRLILNPPFWVRTLARRPCRIWFSPRIPFHASRWPRRSLPGRPQAA